MGKTKQVIPTPKRRKTTTSNLQDEVDNSTQANRQIRPTRLSDDDMIFPVLMKDKEEQDPSLTPQQHEKSRPALHPFDHSRDGVDSIYNP